MKKANKNSITEVEQKLLDELEKQRDKVQTRYPLLFIFLVTFGAVATLQGFNKIISGIDIFEDNPWIMFVSGLLILTATGTLYQKLK